MRLAQHLCHEGFVLWELSSCGIWFVWVQLSRMCVVRGLLYVNCCPAVSLEICCMWVAQLCSLGFLPCEFSRICVVRKLLCVSCPLRYFRGFVVPELSSTCVLRGVLFVSCFMSMPWEICYLWVVLHLYHDEFVTFECLVITRNKPEVSSLGQQSHDSDCWCHSCVHLCHNRFLRCDLPSISFTGDMVCVSCHICSMGDFFRCELSKICVTGDELHVNCPTSVHSQLVACEISHLWTCAVSVVIHFGLCC